MKVLEQCFCPLFLLPPLPTPLLCSCVTVYAPAQVQQHVPLCTVMYPSLCFLLLWVIALHADQSYPKCFPSQTEVISNYWGGFLSWMCICVSVLFFSLALCMLKAMVYFVFHPVFPLFVSVYSRLHVWMHNITIQTSCSYVPLIIHLVKDLPLCSFFFFSFQVCLFHIKCSWILHLTLCSDLVKPCLSRTILAPFIPCNAETVRRVSQGQRF